MFIVKKYRGGLRWLLESCCRLECSDLVQPRESVGWRWKWRSDALLLLIWRKLRHRDRRTERNSLRTESWGLDGVERPERIVKVWDDPGRFGWSLHEENVGSLTWCAGLLPLRSSWAVKEVRGLKLTNKYWAEIIRLNSGYLGPVTSLP